MDIENFEFRPLTDGLGFDKTTEESRQSAPVARQSTPEQAVEPITKTQFEMPEQSFDAVKSVTAEPVNPAPVSRSLKKMLDSLPPSVDFAEDKQRELKMKAPQQQPALEEIPVYQPPKENNFDVTLDNSLSQAFPKEEVSKKFYHQMVTPIPQYKETAASFASAFIDGLVVLALASLFVVALVAITGVDIVTMLTHNELSTRTMTEIGFLYIGVTLFYFMLSRGMFGSTLGDWAFDVQLGSEKERHHIMYPFQVIFRTLVIIATGVITIPVVSLAFGKDIAYHFSGLKLYTRQY